VPTQNLYDPLDPTYLDPVAARAERDRTFQVCSDCRICVRFCPSFKDLFKMIDADEDATDVSVLTDDQHRVVVDECYQCKLCYVVCPYTPGKEQEWVVDFPRLMLRSLAIQQREGRVSRSAKLLARTDLQGKVATALAPLVNRTNDSGLLRGLMEKTTGVAKDRLLPTYARVRFSKWFRGHERERTGSATAPRGAVALFPTCLVEYQEPAVGEALVGVYERNGIACDLPDGEVCCGMPWLDAGDIEKFEEHAKRNVDVLARRIRAGKDVVVPQPTCA
jgi:Fe-S oxidoreductase